MSYGRLLIVCFVDLRQPYGIDKVQTTLFSILIVCCHGNVDSNSEQNNKQDLLPAWGI